MGRMERNVIRGTRGKGIEEIVQLGKEEREPMLKGTITKIKWRCKEMEE